MIDVSLVEKLDVKRLMRRAGRIKKDSKKFFRSKVLDIHYESRAKKEERLNNSVSDS